MSAREPGDSQSGGRGSTAARAVTTTELAAPPMTARVRPVRVRSSQVRSNTIGADGALIVPPGGSSVGAEARVEVDR